MLEPANLQIRIEPWTDTDLALLHRLNAPEMMKHLGGPESEEQIIKRHNRYKNMGDTGCMFSIILHPGLEAVGSVGYWERLWQEKTVYEIGWAVLPSFQGKGIAGKAVAAAIANASDQQKHRYIHAFPSIHNAASNAICRKLNFSFIAECPFEYPLGSIMQCNDWCFDLKSLQLE
ncbi:GNAT family N-acetyltransferase [Risungbinella massiliensis]|uniref:GNAT family N-acetyltransferase n=1 Tax=Risungbinella massiliensis TaxID=1329796 RepID=UPI0005CC21B7|nr:GNAT family N-acetyltransferase [Risungbinella massiliensis]